MAKDEAGEKSEQATPQKIEEFRKKGQVAQSREVATFLLLTFCGLAIWGLSGFFLFHFTDLFTSVLTNYVVTAAREGDYANAIIFAFKKVVYIIAPILLVTFLVAFTSSIAQVGFVFNEEAMKFKFEKINPVSGLKRMFSLRSLVEGMKATAKVTIIGIIVFLIIRNEIQHISVLVEYNAAQLLSYFGTMAVKLVGSVILFMAVLAVLDYGYQKWEMNKQMKMTKQEVKEETKNREGDPLIKARIRRVQKEIANQRMMSDVPKADVIITNPTHIAVAIKYQAGMPAPILLAKGADLVAERIKSIAKDKKIPIVENKPLARAIFKTLKIGQLIPRELFKAVAEVLAYVYRLKNKKRKA